jgi:hypothetical protein
MAKISAACRCRCAKASLSRLLARRVDRIFLSDFEQGEIGPDLFRHADRGQQGAKPPLCGSYRNGLSCPLAEADVVRLHQHHDPVPMMLAPIAIQRERVIPIAVPTIESGAIVFRGTTGPSPCLGSHSPSHPSFHLPLIFSFARGLCRETLGKAFGKSGEIAEISHITHGGLMTIRKENINENIARIGR